jgi:hypothetical protein
MWRYSIRTRKITENGVELGTGYSGFNEFANNPEHVAVKGKGPIPPGKYRVGLAYKHDKLGPMCMNLDPLPGTNTHGRSHFRLHGDNSTPAPFDGSWGCIVMPRTVRERMIHAQDRILEVTE